MAITKTVEAVLEADPDAVFRTLTDIARLPEWNDAITKVVDQPSALDPGAEWVVEVHALGQRWNSRSRVEEIDRARHRFTYRSCTDDGNPSYALWTWVIEGDPAGSRLTLTWDLHPVTFWRRVLLARIRARLLARKEIPSSLRALGVAAQSPKAAAQSAAIESS